MSSCDGMENATVYAVSTQYCVPDIYDAIHVNVSQLAEYVFSQIEKFFQFYLVG